jgi:hypothetical protein
MRQVGLEVVVQDKQLEEYRVQQEDKLIVEINIYMVEQDNFSNQEAL